MVVLPPIVVFIEDDGNYIGIIVDSDAVVVAIRVPAVIAVVVVAVIDCNNIVVVVVVAEGKYIGAAISGPAAITYCC